jgi:PBP1b-binding outer membrane lipoprotein LpoB
MKKLLVILAMGAFFASCGSNESTETKVEDAVKDATTEVVAAADSAVAKVDSAAGAIIDTAKAKVDTLIKK